MGGAGDGEAKPAAPGGVAPGGKGEAEGLKTGGRVAGKGGMKPGGLFIRLWSVILAIAHGGKPGMPCTGSVGGGIPGGNLEGEQV